MNLEEKWRKFGAVNRFVSLDCVRANFYTFFFFSFSIQRLRRLMQKPLFYSRLRHCGIIPETVRHTPKYVIRVFCKWLCRFDRVHVNEEKTKNKRRHHSHVLAAIAFRIPNASLIIYWRQRQRRTLCLCVVFRRNGTKNDSANCSKLIIIIILTILLPSAWCWYVWSMLLLLLLPIFFYPFEAHTSIKMNCVFVCRASWIVWHQRFILCHYAWTILYALFVMRVII